MLELAALNSTPFASSTASIPLAIDKFLEVVRTNVGTDLLIDKFIEDPPARQRKITMFIDDKNISHELRLWISHFEDNPRGNLWIILRRDEYEGSRTTGKLLNNTYQDAYQRPVSAEKTLLMSFEEAFRLSTEEFVGLVTEFEPRHVERMAYWFLGLRYPVAWDHSKRIRGSRGF